LVAAQLEKMPGHALVIEADYARILDPKRWPHYTPAFRVKAVAEIFAFHPALRVVFASSRKLAQEWTRANFAARKEDVEAAPLPLFLQRREPMVDFPSAAPIADARTQE
jgi:hypothetical protein